jgi:hypothetical protein
LAAVAVAQPTSGRPPDDVRVDVLGLPRGGARDAEFPVLPHDRDVHGQGDEAEGRKRLRAARAAIRRREDDFLAELPPARRATLLTALRDLSAELLARLTAAP